MYITVWISVRHSNRRLKHVKEEKLADRRGGWTAWLREVELSTSQADRFEKVYVELDGKFPTSGSMVLGHLYEIALMPPEYRDQPHSIPSSGVVKTVEEMTVRELREVKAELKRQRERAEKAEADYETVRDTLESIAGS